jgi:hypothetical protein
LLQRSVYCWVRRRERTFQTYVEWKLHSEWFTGWSHSIIMDILFNGTSLQRLILSGGALSNGYLDVNETLGLFEVTSLYDVCGSDFEIGLPVEPTPSMGACFATWLGVGFCGAFTASMRYEGGFIFISGALANCGRIGDAGSDKPEAIMLLSAGTHISSHLALVTYPQDRVFSARSFLKPYAFSTPSHVSIRIRLYCSRNACRVQLESKSIHVF